MESTNSGTPSSDDVAEREPLIHHSVVFAAARDVLLERFAGGYEFGIKLQRSSAESLSHDIADRALAMQQRLARQSDT